VEIRAIRKPSREAVPRPWDRHAENALEKFGRRNAERPKRAFDKGRFIFF
jgi:hypothetical protein